MHCIVQVSPQMNSMFQFKIHAKLDRVHITPIISIYYSCVFFLSLSLHMTLDLCFCMYIRVRMNILKSNYTNARINHYANAFGIQPRYLLTSLALNDFAIGILITPLGILPALFHCWPYGEIFCQIQVIDFIIIIFKCLHAEVDMHYKLCNRDFI